MTDVLYVTRQVILFGTSLMHSIINAMALATSARNVQRKFTHQEHHNTMTDHSSDHIMTTTIGTDYSPFITDAAQEDASINQDHATDLTGAEAPAAFRGMDPTLHPTTTAALYTHPLKDTQTTLLPRHTAPAQQQPIYIFTSESPL